jgi:hypothetical protein
LLRKIVPCAALPPTTADGLMRMSETFRSATTRNAVDTVVVPYVANTVIGASKSIACGTMVNAAVSEPAGTETVVEVRPLPAVPSSAKAGLAGDSETVTTAPLASLLN